MTAPAHTPPGALEPAQRLEVIRERMLGAPPAGMTREQVDAWFVSQRASILTQIVESSRGHAYRVGDDWFVDAGMLECVAAAGPAVRTATGWTVALADVAITCERLDAPSHLPGQRGSLYRCVGGRTDAERLVTAGSGTASAVLVGSFDAWPARPPRPVRRKPAPRVKAGCACGVSAGSCGCSKKHDSKDSTSRPEEVLRAAGLLGSNDAAYELHDLFVYRPADAAARERALEALARAGFRPQVHNGQVVTRRRPRWS